MNGIWIWIGAIVLYAGFYLWYDGLRRPLLPEEVEAYMTRLEESPIEASPAQRAAVRAFLEADDGGEFLMVNLVRVHQQPVRAPGDDTPRPAREVLEGYTGHFMPALLWRAGHPALLALGAGGYLEQWNVDADPGWSFAGVIRYRSRRDMIELVLDPRFADAHLFKQAAIERTFAFPARPGLIAFSPRIVVALVLALLAALVQLARR